jgi:hypothetical protein
MVGVGEEVLTDRKKGEISWDILDRVEVLKKPEDIPSRRKPA